MTSAPPASPSRSPIASKRRLFGLTGLAPLRDVVRPPYRPEPGRGRGRPPLVAEAAITVPALPPVPPLDRQPFDYSDLAHWMTQMDQTIRQARRTLDRLRPAPACRPAQPASAHGGNDPPSPAETEPDVHTARSLGWPPVHDGGVGA